MDEISLKNCRELTTSWQICIDNRNVLWKKIAKKKDGQNSFRLARDSFRLACELGHYKMASVLTQKVNEFKIDVNKKDANDFSCCMCKW